MNKLTQTQHILHHLKRGCSITAIEALDRFNCFRLSGRIFEIKKSGVSVVSETVTSNGKHFKKYFLSKHKTK